MCIPQPPVLLNIAPPHSRADFDAGIVDMNGVQACNMAHVDQVPAAGDAEGQHWH
jgi:hypothetical protein